MACPICKSKQFYVKDPDDAYEYYEFEYQGGQVQFSDPEAANEAPEISDDQEIYCQRCSWHGKISVNG